MKRVHTISQPIYLIDENIADLTLYHSSAVIHLTTLCKRLLWYYYNWTHDSIVTHTITYPVVYLLLLYLSEENIVDLKVDHF